MTIGERIKEKRIEMNLSQEELANKMGYKSKTSIFKVEQGVTDLPLSKVEEFAKVLKTTASYLMGWDDEKKEWTRLKEALLIQNMDISELAEKTEIKKTRLIRLLSNADKANTTDVYFIAKALNISEVWLMGYDVIMERVPDDERGDEWKKKIKEYKLSEQEKNECNKISNMVFLMFDDENLPERDKEDIENVITDVFVRRILRKNKDDKKDI